MQSTPKILAPVDLNGNAGAAIDHAIEFAQTVAGDLVLLHVQDFSSGQQSRSPVWPLQALAAPRGGVRIQKVMLPGKPAPVICGYADLIGAGMIFMASRARSGWRHCWRGSVPAAVLDSTPRPVFLANLNRGDGEQRFRCRRILCVLSLDGADGPLIDCAGSLAARSGAEITILHVLPEASEALLSWGFAECDRPLSGPVAMDRIRDIRARLPAASAVSVVSGALHGSIAAAARQTGADIIVAGRRRPAAWALGGPDPGAVVRRTACPILSVPVFTATPAERLIRQEPRAQQESVACSF